MTPPLQTVRSRGRRTRRPPTAPQPMAEAKGEGKDGYGDGDDAKGVAWEAMSVAEQNKRVRRLEVGEARRKGPGITEEALERWTAAESPCPS